MKLNMATRLGLMAAGYLAEHVDEGWIRASTIADEYGLLPDYLVRIMEHMVRLNLLKSKKGPKGGYALARPAKDITLLEIIEAAEGPIAYMEQLADLAGTNLFAKDLEEACKRASDKAISILSRANLGQMVGK